MTSHPEAGPTGLAVVAGTIVLGAVPVFFALLETIPGETIGNHPYFRELFSMAGPAGVVVALAGLVATLVSALLTGLSVRRASVSAALALAPLIIVWFAALLGTARGMAVAREIISHASPADQPIITLGAMNETSILRIFAFAWSTAVTACVGLACFVAMTGPARGPRLAVGLATTALAAFLVVSTRQHMVQWGAFEAVLHADPADHLALVTASVAPWLELGRAANALLLLSAVGVGLGAALLGARGDKGAGVSLATILVIFTIGLRGFAASCERALVGRSGPPALPALEFRGLPPDDPSWVRFETDDEAEIDRVLPTLMNRHQVSVQLSVQLSRTLSASSLLHLLQTARRTGFRTVELVGGVPRRLDLPPAFAPAVGLIALEPHATLVMVRLTTQYGEDCAGYARWTNDGLEVEARGGQVERWPPAVPASRPRDLKCLDFGTLEPAAPVDLVRASLTALSRGHVLALRVAPGPQPSEIQ